MLAIWPTPIVVGSFFLPERYVALCKGGNVQRSWEGLNKVPPLDGKPSVPLLRVIGTECIQRKFPGACIVSGR